METCVTSERHFPFGGNTTTSNSTASSAFHLPPNKPYNLKLHDNVQPHLPTFSSTKPSLSSSNTNTLRKPSPVKKAAATSARHAIPNPQDNSGHQGFSPSSSNNNSALDPTAKLNKLVATLSKPMDQNTVSAFRAGAATTSKSDAPLKPEQRAIRPDARQPLQPFAGGSHGTGLPSASSVPVALSSSTNANKHPVTVNSKKDAANLVAAATAAASSTGNPNVFKCPVEGCNKIMTDRKGLRKHMMTHRPKKFVCHYSNCSKRFYERAKLKRHFLVHTQEKPYICDKCGKAFGYKANLKTHMRTHTGDKPFQCQFPGCDRRFAQASNRNAHMLTHQKESAKLKSQAAANAAATTGVASRKGICRPASGSAAGKRKRESLTSNAKTKPNKRSLPSITVETDSLSTMIPSPDAVNRISPLDPTVLDTKPADCPLSASQNMFLDDYMNGTNREDVPSPINDSMHFMLRTPRRLSPTSLLGCSPGPFSSSGTGLLTPNTSSVKGSNTPGELLGGWNSGLDMAADIPNFSTSLTPSNPSSSDLPGFNVFSPDQWNVSNWNRSDSPKQLNYSSRLSPMPMANFINTPTSAANQSFGSFSDGLSNA